MFRTRLRSTLQSISFLLMATMLFACSSGGDNDVADSASAGGTEAAPAAQIPTGHFVGPVTETMDAGGYTYVKLEKNGESIWAAGPVTKVAVGDELFVELAMPMPQFESPALGRQFDVLYFVGSFGSPAAAGGTGGMAAADPPAGMPGMGGETPSMENPHAGLPGFEDDAGAPKVASLAKPQGGYQIAEIWGQRDKLVDSEVLVRGEVVKYNPQILGVNWVHIQDGSGDAGAGTHDLTVTTSDEVSVGDIVTVRGRLVQGQDFGSGYQYELLVEKASVQSES